MDQLTRYDVAVYNGILMVVVESDLLPPDPAVVIIPLLSDYPAIMHLNPTIQFEGRSFTLATRLIAAVRRSSLRRLGNVSGQAEQIVRAVDILVTGV